MRHAIAILLLTVTAPASARTINFWDVSLRVNAASGVDIWGTYRDPAAIVVDVDDRTLATDVGRSSVLTSRYNGARAGEHWTVDEGFGVRASYVARSTTIPRARISSVVGVADIVEYDPANGVYELVGDLTYSIEGTYQTQYTVTRNDVLIESGLSPVYAFSGVVSTNGLLGINLDLERPRLTIPLIDHTGVAYGQNDEILFSGQVGGRDITLGHVLGDIELTLIRAVVPEPTVSALLLGATLCVLKLPRRAH